MAKQSDESDIGNFFGELRKDFRVAESKPKPIPQVEKVRLLAGRASVGWIAQEGAEFVHPGDDVARRGKSNGNRRWVWLDWIGSVVVAAGTHRGDAGDEGDAAAEKAVHGDALLFESM